MKLPLLKSGDSIRRICWAVLALSFALRAILAYRGGQLFWPDEDRFEVVRKIARILLDGRIHEAAGLLLGQPDHLLFKLASLLPAGLEVLTGAPGWISALFFAAASTWVLWLVGRVSRAAGGSETESLVAVILAACTTSLFYYSRHFFPYDLSLGLFLVCLLAGLRETTSPWNSLLTGLWAGLGYLAYNGYWTLGALLLVTHIILALPKPQAMATRATYALLGLFVPIMAVAAVSRLLGHDFFALSFIFAGTANQGELDQPWEFAANYLWAAEHGVALFWGVALLAILDRTGRPTGLRALLWPGLALTLGALLILPPILWHHFAVTGRQLRVLTPFLCLTTASALCTHPSLRGRPRVLAGLLGLIGVQAAFNFAAPLAQIFPRDFERMAIRHLAAARKSDLGPYKIINAGFLHNPDLAPLGPDLGTVLLRRKHPFQFTPYLFEGYPTVIRNRYLERDLSMRVVRLDAGGPPFRGYPEGMLELTLRFPLRPEGLLPEPLLSTGSPGRGDTLFFRYDGINHFVLGHDHIGGGATLTPRLPLDRHQTHRVLIGMDTFYPPGVLPREPRRFVMWDDAVLLHGPAELHPTTADQITIGHNFIGTSTATSQLSAEILSFRRIPFPHLGTVFPQPPGVLRLELLLPLSPTAIYSEPLLSSGPSGRGDLLFLRSEGGGRFRIGHDHWGGGAEFSEPFELDLTRRLELIVAMGSFFPKGDASTDDNPMRRRLYVSCNGQVVFNRITTFHPGRTDELSLGENRAGSTAVSPHLTTEMLACEPAAPNSFFTGPTGFPGALRLKLRFHGSPAPGQSEPILSTGQGGTGDLLFIRFDGLGNFQVGLDHWGYAAVLSAPQPLEASRPLELTIAMGSLLPPAGDSFYRQHAECTRLKDHLFVASGDTILLNQPASFHDATADSRIVGLNRIGASSATEILSADVLDYAQVPADKILPLLPPR